MDGPRLVVEVVEHGNGGGPLLMLNWPREDGGTVAYAPLSAVEQAIDLWRRRPSLRRRLTNDAPVQGVSTENQKSEAES